MRFCPHCKTAPATHRYSPPEFGGFYVTVCEPCLQEMREERRDAMALIHAPSKPDVLAETIILGGKR